MSLSKSEAKNVLWTRGELSWKLHDGQHVIERAFKASKGTLAVMLCARRFGKTYWACVKSLEVQIRKPKARVIIATAFQTDITEIVKPIFDNILQDQPRSVRPTYKESKKKFVFDNGSEIVLCGLDKNPDGGRGRAVDLYVIDEAGFIKSGLNYLYESIILPMTMNQPGAKVVMISTPPRNIDHPFLEFFAKEKSSVKLTIYDNPMVNEATIKKFKDETLDDVTWKREYMCIQGDSLVTVKCPDGSIKQMKIKELKNELSKNS